MKKIIFSLLVLGLVYSSTVNIEVSNCVDNGDGTVDFGIFMQSDVDIYGFQFHIDPGEELTGFNGMAASGGLAAESGFVVNQGANNGIVLGFSFSGDFVPAQSESALLTTVSYNAADGVDACNDASMGLLDATPGETATVWDYSFTFGGHIFSSFQCSDGTSMTIEECSAAAGSWDEFNAELVWSGNLEIEESLLITSQYLLGENYPNPFNPSTVINYEVQVSGEVSLVVFNMLGQEIISLASGHHLPNKYSVEWNGLNASGLEMPAGMYVYKLISDQFVESKKMLFVK